MNIVLKFPVELSFVKVIEESTLEELAFSSNPFFSKKIVQNHTLLEPYNKVVFASNTPDSLQKIEYKLLVELTNSETQIENYDQDIITDLEKYDKANLG